MLLWMERRNAMNAEENVNSGCVLQAMAREHSNSSHCKKWSSRSKAISSIVDAFQRSATITTIPAHGSTIRKWLSDKNEKLHTIYPPECRNAPSTTKTRNGICHSCRPCNAITTMIVNIYVVEKPTGIGPSTERCYLFRFFSSFDVEKKWQTDEK